jgi:hypothetical protein
MPNPDLIELYTQGECHIFAAANVMRHGGTFLVAFDSGAIHWETDDEIYYEILHVYSVHEVEGREVIRDILGDRIDIALPDLKIELEEVFGTPPVFLLMEFNTAPEMLGYISDPEGRLADALGTTGMSLSMDHDERPLSEASARDIEDALGLEEVRIAPGQRKAPVLPVDEELSGPEH